MADGAPRKNLREDILERSAALFAADGYDGVSMRDVSAAVGVTVAALYYHFPDKEQLYIDAVSRVVRGKTAALTDVLASGAPPWTRLERFIATASELLATDGDFLRLMQWILLDNNPRVGKLATAAFNELWLSIADLAADLGGDLDAHMLASSIVSMVFFPYISQYIHQFLPALPHYEKYATLLERHVMSLLRGGLAHGADDKKQCPGGLD